MIYFQSMIAVKLVKHVSHLCKQSDSYVDWQTVNDKHGKQSGSIEPTPGGLEMCDFFITCFC